jgi:hypothetical protein
MRNSARPGKKVSGDMGRKIERDVGQDGSSPPNAVVREIDENLKRVYREVVDQGVPDRFAKLLEALRTREESSKDGDS